MVITAQDIEKWKGFVVYLWERHGKVLYVGATKQLMSRLGNHNLIGKKIPMKPEDKIIVHRCADVASMVRLERDLIERLQPLYNRAGVVCGWGKRKS